ncbi:peptidoglycan DD-metalloendopeptidase family protein [Arenimonas composti]|uniref:LysM domain-containing protein n=1 Tax=Arenimonas composti TR7-09 = DSM 18010 TaxID=1121013 RepID=A0A091BEY5_9GAMM|nr:peptidoglycan DD-metalloendopeptidase family protein [Arenimonas composti]KFN50306.1 hypothetical protein P873_06420 [Arenimonas composti TR7-09 = DSM 18010]
MKRLPSPAAVFLMIAAVVMLAGCGHSRVVQREPGARPASSARPAPVRDGADSYTVQRGDTLYGIAFRHGLDYRDVAGWNRIAAPYTIYPGQRLRLRPEGAVASRPPAATPASPTPASPTPASPTPANTGVTGMPPPRSSSPGFVDATPPGPAAAAPTPPDTVAPPATAGTPPPANAGSPPPRPTVPTVSPATPAPATPVPVNPGAVSASGWSWPTEGQLIGRFVADDPKRQGLDIAGTAGQPVRAAADGVVVYSGAGLVGYGELIIVKHSDDWLSAYAHNRVRLVAEGASVRRGQQIAELGRSGTSRDMLHFEVRRAGKPVDPLTVLPAR